MSDKQFINSLIGKVKGGNTSAYRQIVEEYQDMAFTVALNIIKNREEAEEVAQDAFIKAYKSIHQFKGDSKFSSWLYRIIYNTALTRLKKKKLDTFSLDAQEYDQNYGLSDQDGWSKLLIQDQKKYIKAALDEIEDYDRLLISLYYLAEESLADIGEIMGVKPSTAKVQLHRARQKLSIALNDLLKNETLSLI